MTEAAKIGQASEPGDRGRISARITSIFGLENSDSSIYSMNRSSSVLCFVVALHQPPRRFTMRTYFAALALFALATAASAAPTTYNVDPDHTHPSFEVDHFGGLSVWRGLFKKTTGTVVLDTKAMTGSPHITTHAPSITLPHDKLTQHPSA